ALDPLYERGGLCYPVVQHMPLVVVILFLIRTASKLLSHEQVLDPFPCHCGMKVFAIKVWNMLGIGVGSCIDKNLDPGLLQQPNEPIERMVGMSHRKETCLLFSLVNTLCPLSRSFDDSAPNFRHI